MPKIKILNTPKSLRKFQVAGPIDNCPPGMVWDESMQTCVQDTGYDPSQYNNRGMSSFTAPLVFDTKKAFQEGLADQEAMRPQMSIEEIQQERNYENWKSDPRNELAVSGAGKGFYDDMKRKTGLEAPTYTSDTQYQPFTQPKTKKPSFGQQLKGLGAGALKGLGKAGQAVNSVLDNPYFQLGAFGLTLYDNKQRKKDFEKSMRERSFNQVVDTTKDRGWTNVNTGMQGENLMAPPNVGMFANYYGRASVQFGGEFVGKEPGQKVKIKILSTPDQPMMKYGGQSGHALDMGWRKSFTNMNTTSSDHYKDSMSETNDGSPKAIEVEGGETMYKPADQTLHNFNGPRHSEGGIKLTEKQISSSSKPGSTAFVYSDTPSLKIKDPKVLAHFGVKYKRGGVTPAEISKKFDLNKYKAILQDVHSDKLAKETAQKMIDKNETYLAQLATHQEENLKKKQAPDFAKQKLSGNAKYGGLYKFVDGGDSPDPDNDPWIKKILEFEAKYGSDKGKPLSNWGYNSRIRWSDNKTPNDPSDDYAYDKKTKKKVNIDDVVEIFKQDYLPKVQQYPLGIRERMADYIYNSGRNPNDLLLFASGLATLDEVNSADPKVIKDLQNRFNQNKTKIESLLTDPEFVQSVDYSRDQLYKTTGLYTLDNPNPAYGPSWSKRMEELYGFKSPKTYPKFDLNTGDFIATAQNNAAATTGSGASSTTNSGVSTTNGDPDPDSLPLYEEGMINKRARSAKALPTVPVGQKKSGPFYGKVTQQQFEELKKNNPWYDWSTFDPTKRSNKKKGIVGDTEKFQIAFNEFAEKMGSKARVKIDDLLGEQTASAVVDYTGEKPVEEKKPEPKWICVDGKAVPSTTGAGYSTEAEALKNCDEPVEKQGEPKYICIDGKVVPTNSDIGYKSVEEAAKYCNQPLKGLPRRDYLLPDKTNMLMRAMIPPRAIYPYVPDKAYTPGKLNLEDWRAQAANAFSTQYAAPMATLSQYSGRQGIGAMASKFAGDTAMNITGNIIPTVTSRNVDRANQFGQQEQARRDAFEDYNNQAKLQRYTGYATTLQNYDNALRGYLKSNQDAFERAWKNRMHLSDINDVTAPHFYKDPISGFNVYRNNNPYGVAGLPSGSSSGGDDLSSVYNAYYNQAYETMKNNPNIPKDKWAETANQLAMANIRAARTSELYDPYTGRSKRRSYDFDFRDYDDPRYPG